MALNKPPLLTNNFTVISATPTSTTNVTATYTSGTINANLAALQTEATALRAAIAALQTYINGA